jgi:hypothetical protein
MACRSAIGIDFKSSFGVASASGFKVCLAAALDLLLSPDGRSSIDLLSVEGSFLAGDTI